MASVTDSIKLVFTENFAYLKIFCLYVGKFIFDVFLFVYLVVQRVYGLQISFVVS